jgi:type I restriction enzyme R subunit
MNPRYQQNAVNRTVEAVAKGQNIILVMATGTGKTYAFNIWRLWKNGIKKRILTLADQMHYAKQKMVIFFLLVMI